MKNKCSKILSLIIVIFILIGTLTMVEATTPKTKLVSEVGRDSNQVKFYLNMPQNTELAGDINGNGQVDEEDSYWLGMYLLNSDRMEITERQRIAANTVCDDELNTADNTLIRNYIDTIPDPIILEGTLAENSTYELYKVKNTWVVTVTIPEGTTKGTIGIKVLKERFKYDFKTGNEEASEMYDLEFKVTNKEENVVNGKLQVTLITNKDIDKNKLPEGWAISENEKSIVKAFDQDATETVKIVSKDGEELEYPLNVTFTTLKVEEKQEETRTGNIKVTLTPNKELDIEKIPEGWTLSSDGSSIVKEFSAGSSEIVKIIAKDGSELDYLLQVKNKTTGAGSKIPQTGANNIMFIAIGAVAIIGIVALKKYKKF